MARKLTVDEYNEYMRRQDEGYVGFRQSFAGNCDINIEAYLGKIRGVNRKHRDEFIGYGCLCDHFGGIGYYYVYKCEYSSDIEAELDRIYREIVPRQVLDEIERRKARGERDTYTVGQSIWECSCPCNLGGV